MKSNQKTSQEISTIEEIMALEDRMKNYDGPDKVISSDEAWEELKSLPKNPVSYKTGYPKLDNYIERIEGGELIVVSGMTKNGKTSWCQSLTKNLYDQDIFSLWFSYEMPTKQLLRKFPPQTTILLPAQLYDKDIHWIEEKIVEAKTKYLVTVVFIDHLHFIIDLMARMPSWEVGRVVREIKKLAVKHNVIIFLICHLRKTKLDVDEVPSIDDLRDSSFIAQDSDGVFFITRRRKKNDRFEIEITNETILTVAVHRETGTMEKNINLNYLNNHFYETDNYRETDRGEHMPGLPGDGRQRSWIHGAIAPDGD